jgi:hypothetical protein
METHDVAASVPIISCFGLGNVMPNHCVALTGLRSGKEMVRRSVNRERKVIRN